MDKSRLTFLGVIITIGIIFGDIGTSVLYVMKSFVRSSDAAMNENLVLGFVSLIFWVMTLQTTTKYVMIALKADNHGEGGVFSLFALIKNKTKRGVVLLAMIGGATLLADGIRRAVKRRLRRLPRRRCGSVRSILWPQKVW